MFQVIFNCPRFLRSIICLFLACLLVFCFIAPPYLQAYAFVDIVLSGAISSTMSSLFALSGIQFASSSDLISGIQLAWSNFDTTMKQNLLDLVSHGNVVDGAFTEDTTIPFPVALISSFLMGIYKTFPTTQTSVPSLPSAGGAVGGVYPTISYRDSSIVWVLLKNLPDDAWNTISQYKYCIWEWSAGTSFTGLTVYLFNVLHPLTGSLSGTSASNSLYSKNTAGYSFNFSTQGALADYYFFSDGTPRFAADGKSEPLWYCHTASNFSTSWYSTGYVPAKFTMSAVAPSTDVINPSDLAYTADKSICVDGVLTKAIDDVLAKNPTKDTVSILVPTDAADFVDAKLKDVVVDKDLSDAIDREIANTGSGTITGDITLPTVGDLSPPASITTVFPFSIPWDIARGLAVFKAEPIAPRFEIPFIISGVIDTKLVLDFTKFDFIVRFIRWGELILFIVGLALLSRKVIRWQFYDSFYYFYNLIP